MRTYTNLYSNRNFITTVDTDLRARTYRPLQYLYLLGKRNLIYNLCIHEKVFFRQNHLLIYLFNKA